MTKMICLKVAQDEDMVYIPVIGEWDEFYHFDAMTRLQKPLPPVEDDEDDVEDRWIGEGE